MNLKERGITIGDLLIISIIISTLFFIKKINNSNKQTHNYMIPNEITTVINANYC